MHAYPENLATFVREHWDRPITPQTRFEVADPGVVDPLPPAPVLQTLLSTCYQASLLYEEGRPVRFRMILRDPARWGREEGPPTGVHRLLFTQPLPFNPTELRRLSPAAVFERSMIGVRLGRRGQLEIWGLAHSGTNWIRALEGSRRGFAPLPPSLVISVSDPGRLTVSKGSFTVVRLQGGRLVLPSPSVFDSGQEATPAALARAELSALHEAARARAPRPWARLDPELVRFLRQQVALRTISAIRTAHHGGTVLLLPRELALDRQVLHRFVRLKYSFQAEEPRLRARTLLVRTMNALAEACGDPSQPQRTVGWRDFVASADARVTEADEALTELARFIAGLAAVDGAVVQTHFFELLGFGGEISGELPDVEIVSRAIDVGAREVELEPASAVGTRHRSAYRLCKAVPGSIAVVVSQDGAARAVSAIDGQVTYWEQLTSGVLDV